MSVICTDSHGSSRMWAVHTSEDLCKSVADPYRANPWQTDPCESVAQTGYPRPPEPRPPEPRPAGGVPPRPGGGGSRETSLSSANGTDWLTLSNTMACWPSFVYGFHSRSG